MSQTLPPHLGYVKYNNAQVRLIEIHDLPRESTYEHGHPLFDELDATQQENCRRWVRAFLVRLKEIADTKPRMSVQAFVDAVMEEERRGS